MSNLGRPVNYAAREAKIEAIVTAAIKCFVKKGFHGAGMAEISKMAEVSQASLYQYFSSKNDLIIEIARRYFERDLDALKRIQSAEDFQNALEKEMYLTEDKTGTIMYLEILAESSRNPHVKKIVLESSEDLYNVSYEIIRKGQAQGVINDRLTPEQLTHFIFAYIDGIASHVAIADAEYSGELLSLFIQTILRPSNP